MISPKAAIAMKIAMLFINVNCKLLNSNRAKMCVRRRVFYLSIFSELNPVESTESTEFVDFYF